MNKQTHEMLLRLKALGISTDDAYSLRRIAMTLDRWHELECGNGRWYIERDEATGQPWLCSQTTDHREKTADRERGAERRLGKIMVRYPDLVAYVQGDPRGAALYILRKSDVAGQNIEQVYSSRGVAVFK